jgi:hypothetical protein
MKPPPEPMEPKPTPSIVQKLDMPRIIGTLTGRSNNPGRNSKAWTYNNFGRTETHRVTVIELKPKDRATLQAIAKRYRVKSLTRFLEGCLAAEDRKGSEQVLFRVYEKT